MDRAVDAEAWSEGLSGRCRRALFYQGIRSLDDLVALDSRRLNTLKNVGRKSLIELRDFVVSRGITDAPITRMRLLPPQRGAVVPIRTVRHTTPGAPLMRIARKMGRMVCGVYIIACDTTGRRKIGKSIDVALRLSTHAQNLPCPELPGPLRLVRLIHCSRRSLGFVENSLHWIYEESRIGGKEFFGAKLNPPPESFRTQREVVRYASLKAEGMQ